MIRKMSLASAALLMTIASANADPEYVPIGENNPGADAAAEIFAPALQGGSSEERAERIYQSNVDRKLEHIESSQGSSERLRQEQQYRRQHR